MSWCGTFCLLRICNETIDIKFKSQTDIPKFLRLGITIYNPSIHKAGISNDKCRVVFFPHFTETEANSIDNFLCLKGNQTIKFQEDFLNIWKNESEEIKI